MPIKKTYFISVNAHDRIPVPGHIGTSLGAHHTREAAERRCRKMQPSEWDSYVPTLIIESRHRLTRGKDVYEYHMAPRVETLDELRDALLAGDARFCDRHLDWDTDLPTFGGEAPEDTTGVWSWDEDRVLWGTCADDLRILDRSEFA